MTGLEGDRLPETEWRRMEGHLGTAAGGRQTLAEHPDTTNIHNAYHQTTNKLHAK